jgi:hypothetical protein
MDDRKMEVLRQQLARCDEKEREERKSLYSRRWFVRTLAGFIPWVVSSGDTWCVS